ncbi:WbqC family protein [Shimia sp. Alg240-R146]|uniref:WbqC family protein n=1 Tax=Shimia sp. Alg240-R146 TaxID=2993449 RepID=UPI0022E56484|nr:WbqC family protein [Shimia sp. Alg240-R146]
MRPKSIAIIQPYFFPYMGYFSLFDRADEVVFLDCVQFPRRGRVHRCETPSVEGAGWLTLPVAKAERSIKIRSLQFADNANQEWSKRLARQPWHDTIAHSTAMNLVDLLCISTTSVTDYLCRQIDRICDYLGVQRAHVRSSQLDIDPTLRAQDRIIAIAKSRGASHYINPPGGHALYYQDRFSQNGMNLSFLPPYDGPFRFLLPALATSDRTALRNDLARQRTRPLVSPKR